MAIYVFAFAKSNALEFFFLNEILVVYLGGDTTDCKS